MATAPPAPPPDSTATEAIIALRYWARATSYEPTHAERDALARCDEQARALWRAGIFVGGGGGLGLATAVRVPVLQRLAVSTAFASAGGFYSQYKVNQPCLQMIVDLDKHEAAAPSPLAEQARAILREGGPATVRRLKGAHAARLASDSTTSVPPPHSVRSFADAKEAANQRHEVTSPAIAAASEPPSSSEEHGAPVGDSWEAVRRRYQIRVAGDEPAAALGATSEAWSTREAAAPSGSGLAAGGGGAPPPGHGKRRVVRNAYGDEVVLD